jgi:hypothetical protein
MKRILFFLIFLVGFQILYSGCKKGDDDPFISIFSRKARICGEWNITEGRIDYGTPDIAEIDYYSNGGKVTVQATQGSIDGTYTWTYSINRDGSYKMFRIVRLPYNPSYTVTEEGYWYFLSKNKGTDRKNKECVAFQAVTSKVDLVTYEYQTGDPTIYDIVQLSNKKIKLAGNRIYKKTDGTTITETVVNESIVLTPSE